jgi:hypothetical protein
MNNSNNNKNTTSKDTEAKNKNINGITDYRYDPRVETPDPKAAKNKASSSGNTKEI